MSDPEKWDLKRNALFYLVVAAILIGLAAFSQRYDGPTQVEIDRNQANEVDYDHAQRDRVPDPPRDER